MLVSKVGKTSKVSKHFYKNKENVVITGDIWNRDKDYPKAFLPHVGYDYRARTDLAIVAPFDGEVVNAVNWLGSSYGRQVFVYDGKVTFHIAHLSRVNVTKGDRVKKGQLLGYTGASGAKENTYARHLHAGIAKGKVVNAGAKGDSLGHIWLDLEEYDFEPKPVVKPPVNSKIDKWRKEPGVFELTENVNERSEPNTGGKIIKTHQKGAKLNYTQWGNTKTHTWFKLENGNYIAYGERRVEVYGKDYPKPTVKPFKPYSFTIKKGTYLYSASGNRYAIPTTRNAQVTIIKENPNLNQGLFKADWLIGVKEAWVKLS